MGENTGRLDWDSLRREVEGCRACPLHETRHNTVFGVGNPQADLLIVGEAPGAEEDRQGEPFVGRAGKLLDMMLAAIGLDRSRVFIANTLKCRPPANRDPQVEESMRCRPYLLRQIELIQPRLILAIGRVAAHGLLERDDSLARLRDRRHSFGPQRIPLIVSYHPAYLLRSPDQKGKAWLDLQEVAKELKRGQG
jgi:DNA polymerase